MTVASRATCTLTHSALRAPSERAAASHQAKVRSRGGQAKVLFVLKELSTTSASGA
jgi:hypothetical protein